MLSAEVFVELKKVSDALTKKSPISSEATLSMIFGILLIICLSTSVICWLLFRKRKKPSNSLSKTTEGSQSTFQNHTPNHSKMVGYKYHSAPKSWRDMLA